MYRLSLLPVGLIALLLSTPSLAAQQTTPADPFHHIAKTAQRPPEPPICCLSPLPSVELGPAEEVLSFEEWKAKQEQELLQKQKDGDPSTRTSTRSTPSETQRKAGEGDGGPPPLEPPVPPPPQFRVPLTDRFNYASLDCSARVHYAHRSARSPSNLLSSKKDKYMLSPCNTPGEDKFVVVELCEDIRIDTVQLANFEFFSGVFKDFSVSVARTYTTDPEEWTPAGTYRAKNIRGVQSFHPPASLRDFYRYIRIDFHSNYGNEFYCPISLLRVYGLTHLEHWKWEEWETEYRAKNEGSVRSIAATPVATAGDSESSIKTIPEGRETGSARESSPKSGYAVGGTNVSLAETEDSMQKGTESTNSHRSETSSVTNDISGSFEEFRKSSTHGTDSQSTPLSSSNMASTVPPESSPESSIEPSSPATPSSSPPSEPLVRAESSTGSQEHSSSEPQEESSRKTESSTVIASTPMPTIVPHESRSVPAVASTGESIYRTIMTRLSALEANSTLYLRYVEEQTRFLRDALTRLEEDVGRLEGLSKATTQSFQKIINEMDRQRRRLEREHGELQVRVDYLTDEVILEKRLGIAQLCLLLVVLVFMALTRGSRGEPFISEFSGSKRHALREWGRRQFSSFSSGEWVSKPRTRSPARVSEDFVKSPIPIRKTEQVKFPMQQGQAGGDETPRNSTPNLAIPSSSKGKTPAEIRAPHPRQSISYRPRTPTSSSFAYHAQAAQAIRSAGLLGASNAAQSLTSRPRMRRASSHSTPGPVQQSHSMREGMSGGPAPKPVSAKKWAKSAHLHEIRKKNHKHSVGDGQTEIDATTRSAALTSSARDQSDRENAVSNSRGDDRPKELPLPDLMTHSGTFGAVHSSREPLSISPLQNRSREGRETGLEKLQHGQTCEPSPSPDRKIIDIDTESDNWSDTDAAGSDVDEQ